MAFDYNSYLPIVTGRESGGNPNAKNPNSSASGLFQLIDPTYMAYARRLNPGVSEGALMAQKNNPAMQNAVMQAFTQDNVAHLEKNGIEPNNGSVYAAHFLGPQGAVDALSEDDDTPITDVVDSSAIKANPGVFNGIKTVGDFKRWTNDYKGGQSAPGTHISGSDDEEADKPATGAIETAFNGGQTAAPQSVWDKFKSGGPGALVGLPQEGWNLGDALLGAGVAMSARDNPNQAAALAKLLPEKKDYRQKQAGWTDKGTTPDGKARIQVNDTTGEPRYVPVPDQYQEKEEEKGKDKASSGIIKIASQANNDLGIQGKVVDDISSFQKFMLAHPELKFDILENGKANIYNATGNADENSDAIKEAERLMQRVRFGYLRQEPGPTTKAKLEQTMSIMFPTNSSRDSATFIKALQDAKSDLISGYSNGYNTLNGLRSSVRGLPDNYVDANGNRISDFDAYHTGRLQSWSKSDAEFAPQMEAFRQQRLQPQPSPQQNGGSLADKIRNDWKNRQR